MSKSKPIDDSTWKDDPQFKDCEPEQVQKYKKLVANNQSKEGYIANQFNRRLDPAALSSAYIAAFLEYVLPTGSPERLQFETYWQGERAIILDATLKQIQEEVNKNQTPDITKVEKKLILPS